MKFIKSTREMQLAADEFRKGNKIIGLVPTMGFFHEGHLSLIRESIKQCDITVVSLFVNPTQFAPSEDLDTYPSDLGRDSELAGDLGVDIIFNPDMDDIYSKDHDTFIEVKSLSKILCGVSRPTHFQGVTTIVAKLFNIVKPHNVFFGQKDAQQALIIQKLILELNYDIDIRILPIIREEDGLALSSRNKYLSNQERIRSLSLKSALDGIKSSFQGGIKSADLLKKEGLSILDKMIDKNLDRIDYLEIRNSVDLSEVSETTGPLLVAVAVFIGRTRLIDNIILNNPENGA